MADGASQQVEKLMSERRKTREHLGRAVYRQQIAQGVACDEGATVTQLPQQDENEGGSLPRQLQPSASVALDATGMAQAAVDCALLQGVVCERHVIKVGEGKQEGIPVRILMSECGPSRRPAVIWLHATGGHSEGILARLLAYAHMGFVAVAMDGRYHGARAQQPSDSRQEYQEAVFRAWRDQDASPFLLDNVRDLQYVLDFLEAHPRVDAARIGMTGVSLGGMHTWLCAALDQRISAAAPIIGCQGFRWAIENNEFHGRVSSLRDAFAQIARAQGKAAVDADLVQEAWERLLPGLLEYYDSPMSLPCIAPRPLLIVNGGLDRRCPLPGLQPAIAKCKEAYKLHGCPKHFRVHIQPEVGHDVSSEMDAAVKDFFLAELKPSLN